MRSERELMEDCNLHFYSDTDIYLAYLRSKVDENLLNSNMKTAKIFLEDVIAFRNILERKKHDRHKGR